MYDAAVEVTTEVTMEETTEVINEQTDDTALGGNQCASA